MISFSRSQQARQEATAFGKLRCTIPENRKKTSRLGSTQTDIESDTVRSGNDRAAAVQAAVQLHQTTGAISFRSSVQSQFAGPVPQCRGRVQSQSRQPVQSQSRQPGWVN